MYMDIVIIRSEIGAVIGGHGGHPVDTSWGMLPLGALKLAQEASMAALLTVIMQDGGNPVFEAQAKVRFNLAHDGTIYSCNNADKIWTMISIYSTKIKETSSHNKQKSTATSSKVQKDEGKVQSQDSRIQETMQDSIQLIDKKNSEKEELQKRYSKLVTELDESQSISKHLKTMFAEVGQNLQNLSIAKDEELKHVIQAKKEIIQNYDKCINDAEGEWKTTPNTDRKYSEL